MLRSSRENINGRMSYRVKPDQNHVILPNYIVKEHNIEPHDTIGMIGWSAEKHANISFEVLVHRYNHTVHIPKFVMGFCGFGPGNTASFKIARVRHKSKPRKKVRQSAPQRESPQHLQ